MNKETGQPVYPRDKAAGVGILLSPLAQSKYLSHGSPCERICWVRLKGPTVNLFIVAIYVPHRARSHPAQHNTMATLLQLLKQVPNNDCIVLLGDFNEQLQSKVENCTGKWGHGPASRNAGDVIDMMRLYDLCAINTYFQPRRNNNATFVAASKSSHYQYVGRQVSAKYRGVERSKASHMLAIRSDGLYNSRMATRQSAQRINCTNGCYRSRETKQYLSKLIM